MKRKDKVAARYLSEASTIIGQPGDIVSKNCTNFRRDLRIVCEAAGVGGCKVVLSNDSRFIETVIKHQTVYKCFKKAVEGALNIVFKVRVVSLESVLDH